MAKTPRSAAPEPEPKPVQASAPTGVPGAETSEKVPPNPGPNPPIPSTPDHQLTGGLSAGTDQVPEELSRAVSLTYRRTTIRLNEIDRDAMKHLYRHRTQEELSWEYQGGGKEKGQGYMQSLVESLVSEGQITPIEFYRDEQGKAILIRGYRTVEAHHQIIARRLDPVRYHPTMELPAVELEGGQEVDYLIRAVASNEVRCHLSDEAKYTVAAMLLERKVSATRAARALGISATVFGRYIRRYNNQWMLEHVRQDHITLSDADTLLEEAGKANTYKQLEKSFQQIVAQIEAHIARIQARAKATQEKLDDKLGLVKTYVAPQIKEWREVLKKGEAIAINLDGTGEDLTFECKIDDKDGKLKLNGLNNRVLHQLTYDQLGTLAAKLSDVADEVLRVFKQKQAAQKDAIARLDRDARLVAFYQKHGATDLAAKLTAQAANGNGQSDPNHGKTTPRTETPVAATIIVPPQPEPGDDEENDGQSEYDAAIDGGPD